MEVTSCQLLKLILDRLSGWEEGDIRSVVMHVRPYNGRAQVQVTWNDNPLELCRETLAQCRIPRYSTMVEAKQRIIHALQTIIIDADGYGTVIITPWRKVKSQTSVIPFKVECSFSRRIDVSR
ncbi:MAG: hypothetical protein HC820_02730 [Hydrococcus sp. RM1_1_31]|nr:hypothetical protein [Hydrococcus sp. RM1_1_31]